MVITPNAKFHFNRLILTLVFGIPRTWRTIEKAGPDRVKLFDGSEFSA